MVDLRMNKPFVTQLVYFEEDAKIEYFTWEFYKKMVTSI